jgi:hypothetical protein
MFESELGRLLLGVLIVMAACISLAILVLIWRLTKIIDRFGHEGELMNHELKGINYRLADIARSMMSIEGRMESEAKIDADPDKAHPQYRSSRRKVSSSS